MNFKSSVTLGVILSQLLLVPAGLADSRVAVASSPEFDLLVSAIQFSGKDLSTDQVQAEFAEALEHYEAVAPVENRTERLEQALVSLQILTPDQIQVFESQVEAAVKSGLTREALANRVLSIALQAGAAQFSGCEVSTQGFAVAGFVSIMAGLGALVGRLFNQVNGGVVLDHAGYFIFGGMVAIVAASSLQGYCRN